MRADLLISPEEDLFLIGELLSYLFFMDLSLPPLSLEALLNGLPLLAILLFELRFMLEACLFRLITFFRA